MYIMAQDHKLIMEFGRLEVCKNFTGKKEEKYVLSAWGRGIANPISVGVYATEEEATAELKNVLNAMYTGIEIYEIK